MRCTRFPAASGRGICIVGCFTVLALITSVGLAVAQDDVSAMISAARDSFKPISEEQLTEARTEVRRRAHELQQVLNRSGSRGRRWLDYLQWDAFQQQLNAAGTPEFDPLVTTFERLNRNEAGLELAPFRRLSEALQRYVNLLAIARQENQAAAYGRQLDALSTELQEYRAQPSATTGAAIGRRIDFLAGLGQAPELVAALRQELARPNGLVTISGKLLRDAAADPIDRHDPITDCILGTTIHGRGHTTGSVDLRTLPDDERALLELNTRGRVVSQNRGYNGPAIIRSTGYTNFHATQRIEFTKDHFRADRARVSARTTSDIHSVSKKGGGVGSRLVSKIGMDKAREKQGQANRIAADHAEVRIARRINDEIDDRLGDAWARYRDEYRNPLVRRGALPEHIVFSTTNDAMRFEVTQATGGQLGAPDDPPALPSNQDIVARVHETAFNNYTAVMLGGATISETEPGAGTKADVTLPKFIKDAWENRMDEKAEAEPATDFEPWTLTFRRDQAVTVAFVNGKVELTLHLAHLKSGDDEFRMWDVVATYEPELHDGGVTLRRAAVDAFAVGRDFKRRSVSAREAGQRPVLIDVLTKRSDEGRGIPQTIELKPLEPKDDLAHVGPLPVRLFEPQGGWLTVAWDRD